MADLLERLKSTFAGRYAVESEIGRGGMATVFLAEDLKHRRKVAIKVLHPELTVTLAAERFLNEIEIAAGLNHPHILMLIDSGEVDGLLYYVMPYVPGESLRHRLEREGQLPVEEAVRIAVEVADGLQYAHEQGVIHRDVKPGNILLSSKHAVITDFGIARAITVAQGSRVTSTGLGVGTPLYASPEQVMGAETLDGRTDVYSLGCVLYEMLSGEVPLAASTPQAVQARRMSETPGPIHAMRDTVPPLLDQVIGKALARLPADRWETAEKFGQALMTATMDATPVAKLDLASTPGLEAAVARNRRKPARWAMAVVVVAIAAIGTWLLVQQAALVSEGGDQPGIPSDGAAFIETKLDLEGTFGWLLQNAQGSFAISPNGRELAYCSRDESNVQRLWLADLSEPASDHRVLATGTGCSRVRWTPSGKRVVFAGVIDSRSDGHYAVSRLGGTVAPLTDCQWRNEEYTFEPSFVQLSPDESRILFSAQPRKDLRILPAGSCDFAGGDSILVAGDYGFLFALSWSPQADRILLTTAKRGGRTLLTIGTDRGEQVTLTTDGGLWPTWWAPSGRAVYYTRSDAYGRSPDFTRGSLQVMQLPLNRSGRPEGDPEPVPYFREHLVDWYSMSADGTRAVVARKTDLYRLVSVAPGSDDEPSEATTVSLTDPIAGETLLPFTWPNPRGAKGVDVSSDGRWIAYPQAVTGGSDLFKAPLDGGEAQRLTRSSHVYGGIWSPDNQYLAYFAPSRDTVRLWLVTADGRSTGYVRDVIPNQLYGMAWQGTDLLYMRGDFQLESLRNFDIEFGQWSGKEWRPVAAAEGEIPTGTFRVSAERHQLLPDAQIFRGQQQGASDSLDVTGYMVGFRLGPNGGRAVFSWVRHTGPEPLGSWWWLVSLRDSTNGPLTPVIRGEGPVGWTRDGSSLYWRIDRGVYLWPLDGEKELLMTLPENLHGCLPRPDAETPEFVCILNESSVDLYLVDDFNAGWH